MLTRPRDQGQREREIWPQKRCTLDHGAAIVAASMYDVLRRRQSVYGDLDFWFFAWSRIYIGVGQPGACKEPRARNFVLEPIRASYTGQRHGQRRTARPDT